MDQQFINHEEEISARRRQRIREMQQEKERQLQRRKQLKKLAPLAVGAALVFVIFFAGIAPLVKGLPAGNGESAQSEENKSEENKSEENKSEENKQDTEKTENHTDLAAEGQAVGTMNADIGTGMADRGESLGQQEGDLAENVKKTEDAPKIEYSAKSTDHTKQLGEEIVSSNAVLIDVNSGEILAQKGAKTKINPASMTKILTVLVAAEHVDAKKLDDTFTMTLEITDYGYVNDCSSVGFLKDEVVTVRDLFYGTILPSGADAAVGLAVYVAGSQEAFVEMMNEKLAELGLSDTAHVTNCVGIFDEEHYCTLYDMAMIMEAAVDNALCREVLSAHTYTTSLTEQHPEGITISNWFLRRIEDKDTAGEVLYAKTGYVVQSGNCAASYLEDKGGKHYICVTAGANHAWKCIYDHVDLYKQFLDDAEGIGA